MTGFYGFEHNNLGHATLTYKVGQQTATMSFRLALLNNAAARLIEFDTQGIGSGISLDNGQLVLKLLLMRPGYDVIGVGTVEQPLFSAN